MEDPDIKSLVSQFNHDILSEDTRFDRKNIKRSEQTRLIYSCPCQICDCESHMKIKNSSLNLFRSMSSSHTLPFTWLLEKLGTISQTYSFKLNVPDVAVFHKGKAAFFLVFQRDRTLKFVTSPEKLSNQEIVKQIINIVRNRKKEEVSVKPSKNRSSPSVFEYGKETACIRFMSRNRDNDMDQIFTEDEQGALKVINESEFTGLMWQRSGSTMWKTVRYIQSVLKCRKGIGESFIHFYVFNDCNSTEIFRAGTEENEEAEEALFIESPTKYCEFIFKKIKYLLEKVLNVAMLQIKGEFVRDDNSRIWLIHASDILVTEKIVSEVEEVTEKRHVKVPVKLEGDLLLRHLAHVAKLPKNGRTEKISGIMSKECQRIIKDSGVLQKVEVPVMREENSKAFARLRKLTPYSLEELLDGEKVMARFTEYNEQRTHKNMRPKIQGIDYEEIETPRVKIMRKSWIRTPRTNYTQRSVVKSSRRKISMTSTFYL